jgi:hypothetical protein
VNLKDKDRSADDVPAIGSNIRSAQATIGAAGQGIPSRGQHPQETRRFVEQA